MANRATKSRISPFYFGAKGETGDLMSRSLKLVTVLLCATLAVSACGKRGPLEPPVGDDGKPEQGTSGKKFKGDSTKKVSRETEHRPFVLDGLLR